MQVYEQLFLQGGVERTAKKCSLRRIYPAGRGRTFKGFPFFLLLNPRPSRDHYGHLRPVSAR